MRDEQRHILAAFAQRRKMERDALEAVIEIIAELPELHHVSELLIRGGDDTHIHFHAAGAAESLDFVRLQRA